MHAQATSMMEPIEPSVLFSFLHIFFSHRRYQHSSPIVAVGSEGGSEDGVSGEQRGVLDEY